MKIKNKMGILFMISVALSTNIHAQQTTIWHNGIKVNQNTFAKQDNNLVIDLTVDMSATDISTSQNLTLIPTLVNGDKKLMLKPILLNGRNRHKVYKRELSLHHFPDSMYYAVVRDGKQDTPIQYYASIPYEMWMDGSTLQMEEESCGCGGAQGENLVEPLFALAPEKVDPKKAVPTMSFITPQKQTKNRTLLKDLYIKYPLNKVVIYPEYMDNPQELEKALTMIETINNDRDVVVKDILIQGYASPEALIKYNDSLSYWRADALKNYIIKNTNKSLPIRSEGKGEEWNMAISLLQKSSIPNKASMQAFMETCDRSDAAEWKLRTFAGGKPYQEMRRDIYPKVRRAVCRVEYIIRDFTIEEGRKLIVSKPESLSEYEMYLVAQSYEQDSAEYANAIRTAARFYPDSSSAINNLKVLEEMEKINKE